MLMICKCRKLPRVVIVTVYSRPAQYSPLHVVALIKAYLSLHELHSVVPAALTAHVAQSEGQATTNVIGC